jgi:hypothetical protein
VTNFFLLGSFFVMLIPEFLTNEGLPHALRSIGTQMPVFLMAALSAFWLYDKALRSQPGTKIALFFILFFSLILGTAFNLTKYFVFFPNSPQTSWSFNEDYRNMAHYLLSLPDTKRKYLLIDEKGHNNRFDLPVHAHPVYYLTYGKVDNMEIVQEDTTVHRNSVFLMLRHTTMHSQSDSQQLYPGSYEEHIDWNGPQRSGGEFDGHHYPERYSKNRFYHLPLTYFNLWSSSRKMPSCWLRLFSPFISFFRLSFPPKNP